MATGTRNKRITPQQMKAKLNARVNQQAGHLAALANHVESIADAKVGVAKEIEELKQLGLTLADIEDATDVSVHRLSAFTREARQVGEDTDGDRSADEPLEDGATASVSEVQQSDGEHSPTADEEVDDSVPAGAEFARA